MTSGEPTKRQNQTAVPRSADWFLNGFHRFLKPFLRRHFHAVAIERDSLTRLDGIGDQPLIVYANHPSWWDPLIAHFLHRQLLQGRDFFAPIDAEALLQYRVFEKLGFYGVAMNSTSGASSFLKKSQWILSQPDTAIWITPEGRFADVRDHNAQFMPGLAHLCSRAENVVALPLALEYVFWDERLPVCLVSLGEPAASSEDSDRSKSKWEEVLVANMRCTQDRLSALSIDRNSQPFENLLSGQRGGGRIYDTCRRIKAKLTGQSFRANHGNQF